MVVQVRGITYLVAHTCRTRTPSAIGISCFSIALIFFASAPCPADSLEKSVDFQSLRRQHKLTYLR